MKSSIAVLASAISAAAFSPASTSCRRSSTSLSIGKDMDLSGNTWKRKPLRCCVSLAHCALTPLVSRSRLGKDGGAFRLTMSTRRARRQESKVVCVLPWHILVSDSETETPGMSLSSGGSTSAGDTVIRIEHMHQSLLTIFSLDPRTSIDNPRIINCTACSMINQSTDTGTDEQALLFCRVFRQR